MGTRLTYNTPKSCPSLFPQDHSSVQYHMFLRKHIIGSLNMIHLLWVWSGYKLTIISLILGCIYTYSNGLLVSLTLHQHFWEASCDAIPTHVSLQEANQALEILQHAALIYTRIQSTSKYQTNIASITTRHVMWAGKSENVPYHRKTVLDFPEQVAAKVLILH